MKKNIYLILIAFIVLFANCSSNSQNKVEKDDGKVVQLNTEAFKQKVFNYDINKDWKFEGDKPVVIDFYANWCKPCKTMSPILESIAKEYDGKIVVYKIDVDEEKILAQNFGIQSIPSFLLIPVKGQPQMVQGAMPKESFIQAINDVLLKN